MVSTTLREFIDQRELEIRDLLRQLKAEQAELRIARAALNPSYTGADDADEGETTIKDMIRAVLNGQDGGLASNDILDRIEHEYGRRLERTSLSPQLSRLKKDGEVAWRNGRWFLEVPKVAEPQRTLAIPPWLIHSNKVEAQF